MSGNSPVRSGNDLSSYEVLVNGTALPSSCPIVEIEVTKEINKISSAKIVIHDGDPSDVSFPLSEKPEFNPGSEIQINAGYHNTNETIFKGIIVGQGVRVKSAEEMGELVIRCNDKAAAMTVKRRNRYFLEQTDSDILSTVLGEYDVTPDVQATDNTHKEVIQYDATDWDFLLSRADENGKIVVVDDNKVSVIPPTVSAGPVLDLIYGTSIVKSDLEIDSRTQMAQVTTSAWDYSTNSIVEGTSSEPSVNGQGDLDGKKLSDALGVDGAVFHSIAPIDEGNLKTWADAKLLKARLARIRGKIKFAGNHTVKPDTIISIEGLGAHYNGDAYVSGVYHRIADHQWHTEAIIGLNPNWFTEHQQDVMMPSASGLLPGIDGLHIGTVMQIDSDPDGEFRILVHIPTVLETGDGVWARQSTFYATANAGSFWYPEIDDEVILGFLNNDPRFPIIIGAVHSKTHEPHYTPDADNTYKAIVTNGQIKIEFEDIKKILTIITPNENRMVYSDDEGSITIEDENKNIIVMDSAGITMDSPFDINIHATGNINMEADQNITIKAGMDLAAEGGMNVDVKAGIALTAKGTTTELNGSAQTTVKGGVVMIN